MFCFRHSRKHKKKKESSSSSEETEASDSEASDGEEVWTVAAQIKHSGERTTAYHLLNVPVLVPATHTGQGPAL